MAQISSIKRVEIFPSNRGASNTWSYKNGNPQLVFNFGIQDMYIHHGYPLHSLSQIIQGVDEGGGFSQQSTKGNQATFR